MKLTVIVTTIALSSLPFGIPAADADSTQATCEVRKHGDAVKDASGSCTFSQRQGYIDLRLRNGDSYSLSPTDEAGHFKDQEGNKVERTRAGGDTQKFEWKHRKIIVTFDGGEHDKHRDGDGRSAEAVKFDDLVGARASSGEAELEKRGFRNVDGFASGTTRYTIWFNGRTHQCLQAATADGRYDSLTDIHEHPKCR